METEYFSKTLACTDEYIRRQNPEEYHPPHRRKDLKYPSGEAYSSTVGQEIIRLL
jgi:hypothetical protein